MRIAIIGPQNTGKSTFIADFIKTYTNYTTPDKTYRDIVKEAGIPINQSTTEESQKAIRDFLFFQARWNTLDNVIFDRCIIDNYVYTYAKYQKGGISKDFVQQTYAMMLDNIKYIDLFIFIPTAVSIPLVDDNTRDTDTLFIDEVNHLFVQVLFDLIKEKNINVKVISGTRENRLKQFLGV